MWLLDLTGRPTRSGRRWDPHHHVVHILFKAGVWEPMLNLNEYDDGFHLLKWIMHLFIIVGMHVESLTPFSCC